MDHRKIVIKLNPEKEYYNFRHLSELGQEAKGGYLDMTIHAQGVPDESVAKVEIDLVEDRNLGVHPNVLFLTPNERRRVKDNSNQCDMTSKDNLVTLKSKPKCWTVQRTNYTEEFDIPKTDGKYSQIDLGKGKLQLTIVKPNQKCETKMKGLFMRPVLEAKLNRRIEMGEEPVSPDEKFKWFSSTKSAPEPRGNLFKVYISVSFSLKDGTILTGVSDEPLLDRGKHFIEIDDIHPRYICPRGPSFITVVMKHFKINSNETLKFCLEHGDKIFKPKVKKMCQGTAYKLEFRGIDWPCPRVADLKLNYSPDKILSEKIKIVEHISSPFCLCSINDVEPSISNGLKRDHEQGDDDRNNKTARMDSLPDDYLGHDTLESSFQGRFDMKEYYLDGMLQTFHTDGATASSRSKVLRQELREEPVQENGSSEWSDSIWIVAKIAAAAFVCYLVKKINDQ